MAHPGTSIQQPVQFRLSFNGPIQLEPLNALRARIAQILEIPFCASLTVIFSSDGGSISEAINFCGFLNALPIPIGFHGVGTVGSAAVSIFLAAHKRTCDPNASFFFHAFDWTFVSGGQTPAIIDEATSALDHYRDQCRAVAKKRTSIPDAELDGLYNRYTKPARIDPAQAKDWGIVQDVLELNPSGEPQPNIAMWTVGW